MVNAKVIWNMRRAPGARSQSDNTLLCYINTD